MNKRELIKLERERDLARRQNEAGITQALARAAKRATKKEKA